VRFTATFEFALDTATRTAIEAMAAEIDVVSIERISEEMRRMLTHRSRATAVELLRSVGLLDHILPELASDNIDPAALAALHLLHEPTFPLALATLILPSVDAPGAWALARRWKLSNDESKRVQWLVDRQVALVGAREMNWSRLQPLPTSRGIGELIALHAALAESGFKGAGRSASKEDLEWCREKLALPAEQLDPPPLLTGDDLVAHGVPRGKTYQRLLQAVRDAQLEGTIHTRAEALKLVDRLRLEE
jgi:tRNA nucleotidyltransferase/poly(A) polymerase